MSGNGTPTPAYYDKLWALIEAAKTDPALQAIMKGKKPWDKLNLLKQYGFTDQEITDLQNDFSYVSDDTSLSWWSF